VAGAVATGGVAGGTVATGRVAVGAVVVGGFATGPDAVGAVATRCVAGGGVATDCAAPLVLGGFATGGDTGGLGIDRWDPTDLCTGGADLPRGRAAGCGALQCLAAAVIATDWVMLHRAAPGSTATGLVAGGGGVPVPVAGTVGTTVPPRD
jgi:hypothetical protein